MRIYIAGPITGMKNDNREAFEQAEQQLRDEGMTPINPIDNTPETVNNAPALWEDYMRLGIAQLITCEGIYLLKGWKHSKGAQMEYEIANKLGMKVWAQKED